MAPNSEPVRTDQQAATPISYPAPKSLQRNAQIATIVSCCIASITFAILIANLLRNQKESPKVINNNYYCYYCAPSDSESDAPLVYLLDLPAGDKPQTPPAQSRKKKAESAKETVTAAISWPQSDSVLLSDWKSKSVSVRLDAPAAPNPKNQTSCTGLPPTPGAMIFEPREASSGLPEVRGALEPVQIPALPGVACGAVTKAP